LFYTPAKVILETSNVIPEPCDYSDKILGDKGHDTAKENGEEKHKDFIISIPAFLHSQTPSNRMVLRLFYG
jgi:hypothetical protein